MVNYVYYMFVIVIWYYCIVFCCYSLCFIDGIVCAKIITSIIYYNNNIYNIYSIYIYIYMKYNSIYVII